MEKLHNCYDAQKVNGPIRFVHTPFASIGFHCDAKFFPKPIIIEHITTMKKPDKNSINTQFECLKKPLNEIKADFGTSFVQKR